MRESYPPIEPYRHGMLDVGDGHQIYWESCGNPDGKPVVFLHGGPGGGCKADHRRAFDPAIYRIVLLDQRGCGRSLPHAADPDRAVSGRAMLHNTTPHLVADLERLRDHLGIERWMVFGGSWGSTLALAYAEAHPARVTEMVLRGIFTLRRWELDWYYGGLAQALFPDRWADFLAPLPAHVHDAGSEVIIEEYHRLLHDPDPTVAEKAAVRWSQWEGSTITLLPKASVIDSFTDSWFALAFARIENHYMRHAGFFDEGSLIRDAHLLTGIPSVIVAGRYDIATPMRTAWDLHRAWPGSELVVVEGAGHAFNEPGVQDALIAATDRFARSEP
ncbi:prolyl aminopeptidase [Pseudonocardia spinosispora]|uniref:prolyl aminopeptidase n=1 Tax=Pseudonocardia spinosispora TaxID=103441 RepID=UPI000417C554|nr:prolyl aminopeptidase [Pseudonocardia spinosispora]